MPAASRFVTTDTALNARRRLRYLVAQAGSRYFWDTPTWGVCRNGDPSLRPETRGGSADRALGRSLIGWRLRERCGGRPQVGFEP